jgi:hypothetical protein
MTQTRHPFFKKRRDQHDAMFFGNLGQRLRTRTGNRFSKVKQIDVVGVTEIGRQKEFREANDLCTGFGAVADFLDGLVHVHGRLIRVAHLDETKDKFVRRHQHSSRQ